MRILATAIGALIAIATVLGDASPASAALIEVEPASVTIDAPAPGHSAEWDLTVTNRTDTALPVVLAVEGVEGPLTAGPTPLVVTVTGPDGTLVDAVPSSVLLGNVVVLEPLRPGEVRTLEGSAALPREAGNAYQGADGRLTFRITAQGDVTGAPGAVQPHGSAAPSVGSSAPLARTGAEIAAGGALVLILVLGGIAALILDRRRRSPRA